jgi:hypothetical protein
MLRVAMLLLLILGLIVFIVGYLKSYQIDHEREDTEIDIELSDKKIIQGKILEINPTSVLLELMGDSKNISDTIRVSVGDEKMLDNLVVEQHILVWYDYIRESYPPQTRGLKIEQFDAMNDGLANYKSGSNVDVGRREQNEKSQLCCNIGFIIADHERV